MSIDNSPLGKHRSRARDTVIRVYDATGNVIETHKHKGDFTNWFFSQQRHSSLKGISNGRRVALLVLLDDFAHGAHLPNLGETFFR